MEKNRLYYGDNLAVLREYIKDETVDLVYLDPPFNSNRNYSVIFSKNDKAEDENKAQIEAFEDTWHWTHTTEQQYNEFVTHAPMAVANALTAYRLLLGENDAMAYLVNMAPRLQELHRVLKPTGSLYLHCDPTMSHYLKVLLDSIFGPERFVNEIIWKRSTAHSDTKQGAKHLGRLHDTILFYSKSNAYVFNTQMVEYSPEYVASKYRHKDADGRLYRLDNLTGPGGAAKGNPQYEVMGVTRYWRYSRERMDALIAEGRVVQTRPGGVPQYKRYLDEMPGVALQDVWMDIDPINSQAKERLGYPTQKPLALLERILAISTNEGDVVLDPFCGCGTTVDAAQRLNRRWIGIDITYIAVDLISKRLRHTYGNSIVDTFDVVGIPRDVAAARALFAHSPFDFERWAVSLINAEPNQKQVGDKGIDGVARFPLGVKGQLGRVLVSVKGGKTLTPSMVRDLKGTLDTQKGAMGILITLEPATKGVQEEIDKGGIYTHPANGQVYPRLQHMTIAELLDGKRPQMPPTYLPYIAADKLTVADENETLF